MGFISRLQRVTVAHIESFLSSVEDPELMFPQLLREMEDQVREATEAEAKAMASVKAAERDIAQARTKLERLQKGAQLAMDKKDEATAREALSAQLDVEADLARKEEGRVRAAATVEDARNGRKQIQARLEELRARKNEILTRARVAKTQKKVQKTVGGPGSSSKSILDDVARLEGKLEEDEATNEVRREMAKDGAGPSLDKRLKDLENSSSVEERLAALKKKSGSKSK